MWWGGCVGLNAVRSLLDPDHITPIMFVTQSYVCRGLQWTLIGYFYILWAASLFASSFFLKFQFSLTNVSPMPQRWELKAWLYRKCLSIWGWFDPASAKTDGHSLQLCAFACILIVFTVLYKMGKMVPIPEVGTFFFPLCLLCMNVYLIGKVKKTHTRAP